MYVADRDWKFVIIATLAGYGVPFLFDIKLFGIPIMLLSGTGALAASILFFGWARTGRRPRWLQHQISWLIERIGASFSGATPARRRRGLPADRRNAARWLLDAETTADADASERALQFSNT